MESLYYSRFDTKSPLGTLTLAVSANGLAMITFGRNGSPGKENPHWRDVEWVESADHTTVHVAQLKEYLAGERREFNFRLDMRGTDFQLRCWHELLRIPYGQTISYGELARRISKPTAFRAVGQANHRNPVSIVVPCHRVVGTDKTLTGYGGGLLSKEWLLKLEGVSVNEQSPLSFVD